MRKRNVNRYRTKDISVNVIDNCLETNAPRAVVFIDQPAIVEMINQLCKSKLKRKRKSKRKLGWKA